MPSQILVVDDDLLLQRSLAYRLKSEGYEVVTATTSAEALVAARYNHPDLILLDIGLPDRDGLETARLLDRELKTPIIFLTARNQETDVVIGLELGAEDYIVKPFRMGELLARIRVVLRRASHLPVQAVDESLVAGEVWLDPRQHLVQVRGVPVELPPKEFKLLHLLMANTGTVLSADYLLNAVWGEAFAGAVQVLYVHIGWLRERLEVDPRHPRYIQTVRGVGYKFVSQEPDAGTVYEAL
jgi:DNA-binding response OmpR family regulator